MRLRPPTYDALPRELHSKVLIKVGYACNSDCVFCHVDHYRGAKKSERAVVMKKMAQIKHKGFDMVALSGGEVTIRPELPMWASVAKQYGLLLGLVSNGRKMADPAYTKDLYGQGLRYAYISFYGATKEAHNYLAGGMDCWQEQIDGVRNLAAYRDMDLTLNVIMCRQNLDELRGIVDLFADIDHLRIKFSALEPKGAAWDNFDTITPDLKEAAEAAVDAIRYGEELAKAKRNLAFGIDGLPPCLVGEDFHATHNDTLVTHGIYYMTETWEAKFYHVDDLNKKHMAACRTCDLAHRCPGIHIGYEGKAQGGGIAPVQSAATPVAQLVEDLGPWTGSCQFKANGEAPPSDLASTFVVREGMLGRWNINQGVHHGIWLKRTVGQVTIDGQPAKVHGECAGCEHSLSCGLAYVPSEEPPTSLAAGMAKLVSGLSGRILDPQGAFSDAFPDIVAKLRGTIDTPDALPLADVTEPYDALLLSGPANEAIFETDAFAQLRSLLRPHGTLVATSSLPSLDFGGESPSLPMATSQQMLPHLENAGLALKRHLPAKPGNDGTWLLVLERPRVASTATPPLIEAS